MRIAFIVFGLALAVGADAATLRVSGRIPLFLNDSTCVVPRLSNAVSPMRIHAQVAGPKAFRDSTVMLVPGATWAFIWSGPSGTYSIRLWPANAAGPSLCDTTITRTFESPPASICCIDQP